MQSTRRRGGSGERRAGDDGTATVAARVRVELGEVDAAALPCAALATVRPLGVRVQRRLAAPRARGENSHAARGQTVAGDRAGSGSLACNHVLNSNLHDSRSLFIRVALVVGAAILAVSVPNFGFVVALMGAFTTMLVSFILPTAFFLRVRWGSLSRLQVTLCVGVLLVGFAGMFVGLVNTLGDGA